MRLYRAGGVAGLGKRKQRFNEADELHVMLEEGHDGTYVPKRLRMVVMGIGLWVERGSGWVGGEMGEDEVALEILKGGLSQVGFWMGKCFCAQNEPWIVFNVSLDGI